MDTETYFTRELSEDEAAVLFMLSRASANDTDALFDGIIKEGGWPLKAIKQRFEMMQMNVDKRVMIMILSYSDGAIGKCVKYCADIAKWAEKNSTKNITFDNLCMDIYPNHIPVM